jgi:hypothetical protein
MNASRISHCSILRKKYKEMKVVGQINMLYIDNSFAYVVFIARYTLFTRIPNTKKVSKSKYAI